MSGFSALFRKELKEGVRTFRLPILVAAFLVVGLASPLLAKLTPTLLEALARSQDTGGFDITLRSLPTAKDAMVQYHKNFGLLPLLVVMLAMSTVTSERSRNTLPMLLVKPVSRRALLLAKLAVPLAASALSLVVSGAAGWLYTSLLFEAVPLGRFVLAHGAFLVLILAYLCLALLVSVVAPSTGAAAGLALGGYVVLATLGALPTVGDYAPAALSEAGLQLLLDFTPARPWVALSTTMGLALVLFLVADRLFARQEV